MNTKDSTQSYIGGFVLSFLFTLIPYLIVTNHLLSGGLLIAVIIGLAIVQLLIQLIFFLHILQESKPRWNLTIFLSTVSIIFILIIGSLWIMNNLNYQMKSPTEIDNYILKDEGINH